jgi:glycosyltransferase involved in cell wall biosynthesis
METRPVRVLFLHNNYPAQFGQFGQYLAMEGCDVTFMTQRKGATAENIDVVVYRDREQKPEHKVGHPFLANAGSAVVTGTSALEVALHLRHEKGYRPDVIMAHSGWGPGLFMKDAWPEAAYVGYFEWFYKGDADDVTYLRGPDRPPLENARERVRNIPILTDLTSCDLGIVPTRYQRDQFPDLFHGKLHVLHDGIDTQYFEPMDPGRIELAGRTFTVDDEIVTYVARGMEPYRGFPEFMAALAEVQKRRPNLQAIVVGEDRAAYGRPPASGKTYKEEALQSLDLDLERITFTGLLARSAYRDVLRLSSVHVYLTVPFVLSWSMMEAMSTGCLLLGSDTAPVREVLAHGKNGYLTDMRSAARLADDLEYLLATGEEHGDLRRSARQTILDRYAARDLYPAKKALIAGLMR